MNKSILVIDTPNSCEDCELCDGLYDYICLRLGEVDESVENGTKDLRCPLKPMPEKYTDMLSYDSDTFERGWNACIDEILGEEE